MTTTVTTKNMITIPSRVWRHFGIRPGFQLDWEPVAGTDEIRVRVLPDRAERARRLAGAGQAYAPERDAVSELVAEREEEG
jgi:bifunctional DNA-binding transcriptional regulator/antitoxin component of YhaV-PrlF toxin-antitoxin module